MADKGRILKRAAVIICAAVVGASAFGLRFSDALPKASDPLSVSPDKISARPASDTGYARAVNDDSETDDTDSESEAPDSASESSRPPEELSSDGGEDTDSGGEPSSNRLPDRNYYYDTYYIGGENGEPSSQSDSVSSSSSAATSSGNQLADDGSHADTPGNNPTDGEETDIEYFTTDIVDGETVEDPQFKFTITHLQKRLTVKSVEVGVNGIRAPWSGEVTLSEQNGGKNTIRVAVTYTDENGKVISAYKSYTVYLKLPDSSSEPEPQNPELQTDLYSHTRSDSRLVFYAYVSGDVSDVKLKVYCKNTRLKSDSSEYSCDLDMGINKIRITAEFLYNGESRELYGEYDIKLIAETTPETAPYLEYCNAPDTVRGSLFTLDLAPRDYLGNKLYYSNLFVRLNGAELHYKWDGEYTSYLLELRAGENTLDIRVTDGEGRYTDYSYVITCLSAQDGEVIGYASLELDANVLGLGALCPEMTVEIRQGESAAASIVRALEESGFTAEGTGDLDSGYYLARLYKPGIAASAAIDDVLRGYIESDPNVHFSDRADTDSLGEKDYTTGSGWMISVNGHYTSYGTSDLHLKDGDTLRLRFTLALGKDIGGYMGGGGTNYDICY